MKKTVILTAFVLLIPSVLAKHCHKENYYQKIWCDKNSGITEYILPDKTRVDCLTKDYALEFDFAHKWAESVGQALYYAKMTKKKPAVALIMESSNDEKYYNRVNILAKEYNITLFKIKTQEYDNYNNTDIFSYLVACFKNYIKIALINLIDLI